MRAAQTDDHETLQAAIEQAHCEWSEGVGGHSRILIRPGRHKLCADDEAEGQAVELELGAEGMPLGQSMRHQLSMRECMQAVHAESACESPCPVAPAPSNPPPHPGHCSGYGNVFPPC